MTNLNMQQESRILSRVLPSEAIDRSQQRSKRRKRLKTVEEVEIDQESSSANESSNMMIATIMMNKRRSNCQITRQRFSTAATRQITSPSILLLAFYYLSCFLLLASSGQKLVESGSGESQGDGSQRNLAEPMALISSSAAVSAAATVTASGESSKANNVILIKYANVTNNKPIATSDDQQKQQQELQLISYRLYEPLSVPVIESKFAHSIQLFDVSQNQLSTLSKDLFCPLSNEVRQLNISHNLLENFDCLGLISQAGQLCLSELRILDMSFNLIKHLPATGVATLHNLEILNLSNNLIESLDELSLSSLFKLTKLDLSNNRITQLPLRIFHKSTSMQVLKLQSNQLQTNISQMFLSGLISLEELNLSQNNISHVSDFAFLDKVNLTRVDLSHNQLSGLRQEALRVTSVKQATGFRHRLHHNGQYAGVAPKQTHSQSVMAEFYLSSNPFICDCQLEWLRRFQPSAIKQRTVLHNNNNHHHNRLHSSQSSMMMMQDPMLADQAQADQLSLQLMQLTSSNTNIYQNDQPSVILTPAAATSSDSSSNKISEILTNNQDSSHQHGSSSNRPLATLMAGPNNPINSGSNSNQVTTTHHYARIGDLDLIKCSPLFRRNTQRLNNQHHHHHNYDRLQQQQNYHRTGVQSRTLTPSGDGHSQHGNGHHLMGRQQDTMIDLLSADSSNFLCRYKSHCFAECHCCDFDACDCEMICPAGCNCYYDSTWQTNLIDCSSNNHTVVPDRIPMDVSGLYLDGNNIDSLKPSHLIARKSLKTLYLNSSNLQYIANRTFNGLIELQTLYLNDNQLRSLNGYEFEPLAQLKALYLQSNRLDHISNQTFIYLRSLEILDLSNNRLASASLDLFWSIGHHNIRLRQLSIAHNWWSCQCSSINRFRQILKQKFLLNGSVNIVDKNQLRCYYNSSTVGPLILSESSFGGASSMQPIYASYPSSNNNAMNRQQNQQQLLTEINQCSEVIEDRLPENDVNPPMIYANTEAPPPLQANENDPYFTPNDPAQQPSDPRYPSSQQQPPLPMDSPMYPSPPYGSQSRQEDPFSTGILTSNGVENAGSSGRGGSSSGMPLTSFILLSILLVGVMVIAVSIFMFVRQQQRFHQSHHKKSSAASTTSASSSASSTAISSLNGKSLRHHHLNHHHLNHHQASLPPQHPAHHLIMSNGVAGGATTTTTSSGINHHHLNLNLNLGHHHQSHHHHSASSQSNVYAALVSPTTGNSTTVSGNGSSNLNAQQQPISNLNNLYSNSSTTASHHSTNSSAAGTAANGFSSQQQQQNWHQQQSFYNQPTYGLGGTENLYAINAPQNSSSTANTNNYKTTGGSLYNASGSNCHDVSQALANQQNDWIKLPKVKQFMSKLVNKSLAFGGYRSCSRDELSAITSDKIYDAFISYDKLDEPFVMQHLSAELEYGQPQYRIANRFRDLPPPPSAFIAEAITSVIGCSHRTIVVLTENYLVSDWCRYELQSALRESTIDKSHKIIAVVLDPKCLLDMDPEMRLLLTTNPNVSIYHQQQQQQQQQQQLVQLDGGQQQSSSDLAREQQQLVATLTNQASGQVSTQTAQLATSKITFINYNERKFWLKIKQLMPTPRPSTQTLTLTTKN